MNNLDIQLHYIQKEILRKLTLTPELKFNELIVDGLESEHMNYHLKKLIAFGLVTKLANSYSLTDKGKDYSNLLDDDQFIEKQPKTSVILHAIRINNKTGEVEHLLYKRLKQPYYGKVGRIGGKVRFGETLQQAAARELFEETGLTANTYILESIYHKLRHREDGTFVQDNLFYIFFVKDIEGTLIDKLPYQENFWVSAKGLAERKDLDPFDDLKLDDRVEPKELNITETVKLADGY